MALTATWLAYASSINVAGSCGQCVVHQTLTINYCFDTSGNVIFREVVPTSSKAKCMTHKTCRKTFLVWQVGRHLPEGDYDQVAENAHECVSRSHPRRPATHECCPGIHDKPRSNGKSSLRSASIRSAGYDVATLYCAMQNFCVFHNLLLMIPFAGRAARCDVERVSLVICILTVIHGTR